MTISRRRKPSYSTLGRLPSHLLAKKICPTSEGHCCLGRGLSRRCGRFGGAEGGAWAQAVAIGSAHRTAVARAAQVGFSAQCGLCHGGTLLGNRLLCRKLFNAVPASTGAASASRDRKPAATASPRREPPGHSRVVWLGLTPGPGYGMRGPRCLVIYAPALVLRLVRGFLQHNPPSRAEHRAARHRTGQCKPRSLGFISSLYLCLVHGALEHSRH